MNRMRGLFAVILMALALGLTVGCGGSREAETVRGLRLSGSPDSARALAISVLSARAARMDVWREFASAALDLARRTDEDEGGGPLANLIEAGLLCGAINLHAQQKPDRDWHTLGRLTAVEVGRRINRLTGLLGTQAQAGEYLQQAEQNANRGTLPGLDPNAPDPAARLRRAVIDYRDGARPLLIQAVILRRLVEVLPESNPGSGAVLSGQLADAVSGWSKALELEPGLLGPIQLHEREALDAAFGQAETDLNELGYWLPKTILENGVLP